ncbi:MAG: MerR family transcriptional regulator, partial [Candidatus Thiodiazotropha sp. 6PDIVS]
MKEQPSYTSGYYPIRKVAELTGINPVTLRAWERRYGLIKPERTPKGHRLYTDEHIQLIRRIIGLIDKGISIGQVRHMLADN